MKFRVKILAISGLILGFFLSFFFFILPVQEKTEQVRVQIEKKMILIENLQEKMEGKRLLRAKIKGLQEEIKDLEKFFPVSEGYAEKIQQLLETEAEKRGTAAYSWDYCYQPGLLDIEGSWQGEYEDLMRFLQFVEDLPQALKIRELRLEGEKFLTLKLKMGIPLLEGGVEFEL